VLAVLLFSTTAIADPVRPSRPRKNVVITLTVGGFAWVAAGAAFGLASVAESDAANAHCVGASCDMRGVIAISLFPY
jgi:hypothetical protein